MNIQKKKATINSRSNLSSASRWRGIARKPLLLLLPAMVYATVFTIFPTVYLVYLSLFRWSLIGKPQYVGLQNWLDVLQSLSFQYSLEFTLIWAGFITSVELALGIGIATLLKSGGRLGRVIQNIVIVPLMMAPILTVLIWKYIYAEALGPGFYLATLFGMKDPAFISRMPNAFFSLALVDIWQWTPFVILVILAGLYSFPESIHEASQIDGASSLQEFRHMILPYLKPFIGITILFRLVDALKTFEVVMLITRGGPAGQTKIASYYIWYHGLGYAVSVGDTAVYGLIFLAIVMSVTVTLMMVFRRSWRGG